MKKETKSSSKIWSELRTYKFKSLFEWYHMRYIFLNTLILKEFLKQRIWWLWNWWFGNSRIRCTAQSFRKDFKYSNVQLHVLTLTFVFISDFQLRNISIMVKRHQPYAVLWRQWHILILLKLFLWKSYTHILILKGLFKLPRYF